MTSYEIKDLDSNTAYQVLVQAIGPLGRTDSRPKVFYTKPLAISGNNSQHIIILL